MLEHTIDKSDPYAHSEGATATTRAWLVWLALVHGLLFAVFHFNRPIEPRAPAQKTAFSEARAQKVLSHLTNDIGLRLSGTPNAERAAEYLADELRAIPGVEVDLQHVSDSHHLAGTFVPWPIIKYHVTNVVARIPGRTRDAVLLNAHFDTLGDSPGAGDDGIGVVSIVEAARALAAGPQLEHSVIILCNGGEEYGLYGADGFIRNHPLAKDVKAYLYIDGGPGGAATLLYSGPGTGSLVEAYAQAAPKPQADSAYLDLIDSGVLSHDGDHRPFRARGVPGLVFATIGDLWACHTKLDRFDRVEPGAVQHLGETMLEVSRFLASRDLPSGIEPERSVYFDVFGAFVVRYSASTGVLLGLLSGFLAALCVWDARRRGVAAFSGIGRAFAAAGVCTLAALLGAVGAGLLLAYVLGRSYSWYNTPWVAYFAFVVPACASYAAVWSRMRVRGRDGVWCVWLASVSGWTALSLWAAFSHGRSGYIPLVWSLSLSLGLLAALRWPARRNLILLAASAPGLYTILHLAPMLRTMLAQAGIQPLPISPDPIVGLLYGTVVAVTGAAIALPVQAFELPRAMRLPLMAAVLGATALAASVQPFSAERPRRVLVTQAEADGRSAFLFRARDVLPLEPVLANLPGVEPIRSKWPSFEVYEPEPTHQIAGPAPSFAPPSAELLSSTDNADGTRTLQLRLHAETPNLRLFVESGRVASWSVHPDVAEPPAANGRAAIYFQGFDPAGETISLTLRGRQPAELELIASTFAPSPELLQLTASFPDWALPVPLSARSVKLRL